MNNTKKIILKVNTFLGKKISLNVLQKDISKPILFKLSKINLPTQINNFTFTFLACNFIVMN